MAPRGGAGHALGYCQIPGRASAGHTVRRLDVATLVLRPGFAFSRKDDGSVGGPRLKGRSAHVIVTMGMPGVAYRVYFRAHSLKSLKRNILHFVGVRPVRTTVIGLVEADERRRDAWLGRIAEAGRQGR